MISRERFTLINSHYRHPLLDTQLLLLKQIKPSPSLFPTAQSPLFVRYFPNNDCFVFWWRSGLCEIRIFVFCWLCGANIFSRLVLHAHRSCQNTKTCPCLVPRMHWGKCSLSNRFTCGGSEGDSSCSHTWIIMYWGKNYRLTFNEGQPWFTRGGFFFVV